MLFVNVVFNIFTAVFYVLLRIVFNVFSVMFAKMSLLLFCSCVWLFFLRIRFVSFHIVLYEISMLLFVFRIMFFLIRVFREFDHYGLARVMNKLRNSSCGKKIYATFDDRSCEEIVVELWINEILQQLAKLGFW